MKRFLLVLMVACMLLCSCNDATDESQNTQATTTEETTAEETAEESSEPIKPSTKYLELDKFTVIYSSNATANDFMMFTRFRQSLEAATGLTFTSGYDNTVADSRDSFEILLGATNRKESSEALAKAPSKGYVVCVIGNKLVINGNTPTALEQGVSFALTLFDKNNKKVADNMCITEYVEGYDSLNGVQINALGDSYFGGHTAGKEKTWIYMLSKKYSMTLNNYGINGSTVSNAADKSKDPMCDRYTGMASGADIILVEGGRNDYNKKVPLGTVDSRDTATFAGALNKIFDDLKAENPNALILGITSWYVNADMKAYSDMMLKVCEKQGIACFNAADQKLSGVRMDDESFRKAYCLGPNDVSHLNDAGMKLVLPKFEKFIGDAYNAHLKAN